jgi:hypothetical protein
MSDDVRTVYQKARIETAKLLGYGDDLEQLTAEQSTRLDIACALRIALDDQAAKVLRGESADVAKLLSASEALSKLLPATVLASPPPASNSPGPREIMLETYKTMRARGAAFGEGLDGAKLTIERLKAELAAKDAEIAALQAGEVNSPRGEIPPVPAVPAPAGNVVSLARPASPPPAQAVDLRATRSNGAGGSAGFRTGPPNEAWRNFVKIDWQG